MTLKILELRKLMPNRRVLLVCKESYSIPFYFLAKNLISKNNDVASYFFNPIETGYDECLMNTNTYFAHKNISNLKVYDNNDILELFTENLDNPPIDYEFLESINKNFTKDKALSLQILSTQFFSKYFHDRFFYSDVTYEQQIYWLQLNYKKVIEIFDHFKPDVIFDLDNAELSRSIISEVCQYKSIPYVTVDHPRFEMYKIPSYSVMLRNDYFRDQYYRNSKLQPKELQIEYNYVNDFRSRDKIMSKVFENDITSSYDRPSLFEIIKSIISKILYVINISLKGNNIKLNSKNPIIFPSNLLLVWFFTKSIVKRWYLLGPNKHFSIPKCGEKFVYMPLHLIPESSTSVLGAYYINELANIEQVSKSLPLGTYLHVKEHQSMVGERPISFYRKVNSLPNVKMISINYFKDPKPLIENSVGVVTVTGSAAYEAALLGKKSIVFGYVNFSVIDGISRLNSYEDLPVTIGDFGAIENIHSCAAYLYTVKQLGEEIDLKYLINEGEIFLMGKNHITSEYVCEIDKLELFFENALKNYCK